MSQADAGIAETDLGLVVEQSAERGASAVTKCRSRHYWHIHRSLNTRSSRAKATIQAGLSPFRTARDKSPRSQPLSTVPSDCDNAAYGSRASGARCCTSAVEPRLAEEEIHRALPPSACPDTYNGPIMVSAPTNYAAGKRYVIPDIAVLPGVAHLKRGADIGRSSLSVTRYI